MISRQTLTRAPLRQRRPTHPGNPQKSCKSCFRQSPQISHKLSSSLVKRSHERPCASGAPPIPKIPKNPANPASDNPPKSLVNSHDHSSNAHTSAPAPAAPLPSRKSPKILQIQLQTTRPTQITAHPQYPMTSYKRCYYPLSTIHYPLSTIHYPLSTIHYPLSTIHYPLSTIHYPLSTIHYPLSTIHYPLSTIHWCPLSTGVH